MTPVTLSITENNDDFYIVNQDGSFLTLFDGDDVNVFVQYDETRYGLELLENLHGNPIENIQTVQAADEVATFTIGNYTFTWNQDDSSFTCSHILSSFAGTGELKSHNFGVDEVFLCNKDNQVAWGMIEEQKVYFEQSAVGNYSTSSTKPQAAAEMTTPIIEGRATVNFQFAGYVFTYDDVNLYNCSPVPTSD